MQITDRQSSEHLPDADPRRPIGKHMISAGNIIPHPATFGAQRLTWRIKVGSKSSSPAAKYHRHGPASSEIVFLPAFPP